MSALSRRSVLAVGAAGGVVTATAAAHAAGAFGNPDLPSEGAVNVGNSGALVDPGPQAPDLANNLPSFLNPTHTDVGEMPLFWSSLNIAPKRVQEGGRARQVTQAGFQISTTISGVNIRLDAGGVRETDCG